MKKRATDESPLVGLSQHFILALVESIGPKEVVVPIDFLPTVEEEPHGSNNEGEE